jgi:hypothetical protein
VRCLRPLLCAGLLLAGAPASAMPPSRCAAIETPERPGRPHVLVPTGLVPHSSPSRIAALAVGGARDAVVPCMELLAPRRPDAPEGSSESEPWWAVHVEARFFQVVRGAHGSCRAAHQMVFIGDRSRRILSAVGIGQVCRIRPYEFLKGR